MNKIDYIVNEIEYALDTLVNDKSNKEPNKLEASEVNLKDTDRLQSIKVMRVNHMGEICAQALYRGQAILTKDPKIRSELYRMCEEEKNHLKLCAKRLNELEGEKSIFNPIWYLSSFCLGIVAGLNENKWKMGFVEETEKQVDEHLKEYIDLLPSSDKRSKKILQIIKEDEKKHKKAAKNLGSKELSDNTKKFMSTVSKAIKKISSYI
tara:strand:- start:7232 stop:7855 length:624 start_codon:yes stop_codon:yes gene_type:complete